MKPSALRIERLLAKIEADLCWENNLFSAACATVHTKRDCEVAIVGSWTSNRKGGAEIRDREYHHWGWVRWLMTTTTVQSARVVI
jgi:hypothetical protein